MKACSWHSLHRLELRGAVPLSRAVAEAVARRCPQLADLRLVHRPPGRTADAALSGEAAAEYDYGRSQLLALCGPRLRELQLLSMETEQWWALSYMSLKWCTALTRLELEAPDWISLQCGHGGGECYSGGFGLELITGGLYRHTQHWPRLCGDLALAPKSRRSPLGKEIGAAF